MKKTFLFSALFIILAMAVTAQDPFAVCGDNICDFSEDCRTCEADCGGCCGDSFCDDFETAASCAKDCGESKDTCTLQGYQCINDADCPSGYETIRLICNQGRCCGLASLCGNDICEANEHCGNCDDCTCSFGEQCVFISEAFGHECQGLCGDTFCNSNENSENCPMDCGMKPECPVGCTLVGTQCDCSTEQPQESGGFWQWLLSLFGF